eukprot:12432499-Ditylum_brightwellii.AAC.1
MQNTVEIATYGSEIVAARTAVNQIVDLCYTLCMLDIPLTGPAWMIGDNLSVVKSVTMSSGKLLKIQRVAVWGAIKLRGVIRGSILVTLFWAHN